MRRALFLLPCLVLGCSSSDATGLMDPVVPQPEAEAAASPEGAAADVVTPEDQASEPEPEGPTCEPGANPVAPSAPAPASALLVTSNEFKEAFDRYVSLHTVLGTTLEIVTREDICGDQCDNKNPAQDTAKALKNYLVGRSDLRLVLLGGDIEKVPSRKVHDSYQNPLLTSYSFEEDFYTDYYYSDFSEWDSNGDGIYAQDGTDSPDYRPEIAVSRLPVSNPEEAERYRQKLIWYLTQYNSQDIGKCLLLSNVATQFLGMDIDGAYYFEAQGRTLSLLPQGCQVDKLYATKMVDSNAGQNSAAAEVTAIEQGYNLIIHSGHGSVKDLTVEYSGAEEFTREMASALKNSTYPIFLSSACEAGTFSAADSAGEALMNAPEGGAIAYLGNTVIGLGLAGGCQLIDELLRYVQTNDNPILGEAYLYAHQNMPQKDTFAAPLLGSLPVVNQDSYEWTQKGVVLMGDLLIPVRKTTLEDSPVLKVKRKVFCEGARLTFQTTPALDGTLRVRAADHYYEVAVTGGTAEFDIADTVSTVAVGFTSTGHLPAYQDVEF